MKTNIYKLYSLLLAVTMVFTLFLPGVGNSVFAADTAELPSDGQGVIADNDQPAADPDLPTNGAEITPPETGTSPENGTEIPPPETDGGQAIPVATGEAQALAGEIAPFGIVDSGTCGPTATWSFNNVTGVLTISGTGAMDDYNGVSLLPVWDAFKSKIKTVKVENGITSVGTCAFYNYEALEKASISDTVIYVDVGAFGGCSDLETVDLGANVQSIHGDAFSGCTNLKNIEFPNSIEEISLYAFQDCSALAEITFKGSTPPAVINSTAFYDVASTGTIYYLPTATGFNEAWKSNFFGLTNWTLKTYSTPSNNNSSSDNDDLHIGSYVAKPESTTLIVDAVKAKAAVAAMKPTDTRARITHNGSIKVEAAAWTAFSKTAVNFDTMADGGVQVRITVTTPHKLTNPLILSGTIKGAAVDKIKVLFEQ